MLLVRCDIPFLLRTFISHLCSNFSTLRYYPLLRAGFLFLEHWRWLITRFGLFRFYWPSLHQVACNQGRYLMRKVLIHELHVSRAPLLEMILTAMSSHLWVGYRHYRRCTSGRCCLAFCRETRLTWYSWLGLDLQVCEFSFHFVIASCLHHSVETTELLKLLLPVVLLFYEFERILDAVIVWNVDTIQSVNVNSTFISFNVNHI